MLSMGRAGRAFVQWVLLGALVGVAAQALRAQHRERAAARGPRLQLRGAAAVEAAGARNRAKAKPSASSA